jgi:hypothetical protein
VKKEDFSDSRRAAQRQVLEDVIGKVSHGTADMIETRQTVKGVPGHPRVLTALERNTLERAFALLDAAQNKLNTNPELDDIPLGEVFTSEVIVSVLSRAPHNLKSVMELMACSLSRQKSAFEYCVLLGGNEGKQQLHMYLFADE